MSSEITGLGAEYILYIHIYLAISQVLQIYSQPSGNLPGLKCQISWNLPPAMKSQLCQPENLANLKPQFRHELEIVMFQIVRQIQYLSCIEFGIPLFYRKQQVYYLYQVQL
ncbi:Hypothetical_protein [Hexamita inflata]|uniref:Hypothetical_protein n=1 Tax=Hexamita inflata TaxID=28002 RepID=A0AA86RUG3_9EUKA|nr:Hypothetical protein HINF_LOCUS65739 [Hexamita inflata]